MKKVTKAQIHRATDGLEAAMKKARRKLLELEIFQSRWEYQHGLGTIYDSADDLIEHITKKLKSAKK